MRSALYTGSLTHSRRTPARNVFRYPLSTWLLDLDELEALNSELQNPGTTYSTKIKDIVELYLINCENLILHGMALNFNKIKKINTKILGMLKRHRRATDQLFRAVRRESERGRAHEVRDQRERGRAQA